VQHTAVFTENSNHANRSLVDCFHPRKNDDEEDEEPPKISEKRHSSCFDESTINFDILQEEDVT
jgi:hypothetical protein